MLVAGENFGIGSSREHAVWAILDYGFQAVVAPRFGDIFYTNSTKSGLVTVVLEPDVVATLLDAVEADPELELTIDLERLTLEAPALGLTAGFPMEPGTQRRFLEGLDDIGLTLEAADDIAVFERARPGWLEPAG